MSYGFVSKGTCMISFASKNSMHNSIIDQIWNQFFKLLLHFYHIFINSILVQINCFRYFYMIRNFVKKDFVLYHLTCITREEIIASVQLSRVSVKYEISYQHRVYKRSVEVSEIHQKLFKIMRRRLAVKVYAG